MSKHELIATTEMNSHIKEGCGSGAAMPICAYAFLSGTYICNRTPLRMPDMRVAAKLGTFAKDMYVPSRPAGAISMVYLYILGDQIDSPMLIVKTNRIAFQ